MEGRSQLPGLTVAGIASVGAGVIHAAAAGVHAEHPQLARLFIVCAAVQMGVGLLALARSTRLAAGLVLAVNSIAVGGWVVTRISGVSWIDGLEVREAPQFADSACALLGAVAVGTALAAIMVGRRTIVHHGERAPRVWAPALAVTALAVPAMWTSGTHVHAHVDAHADADAHQHVDAQNATPTVVDESQPHTHSTDAATDAPTATPTTTPAATWPRPWDPSKPIDLSGVPGVTPQQEARAKQLIEDSLQYLPKYADTAAAVADGYSSIGDAGTGDEHYIKTSLIEDDDMLDAKHPESLVYKVDGDKRTLAGAMYIASARPTDDPTLTDFAGPLMTWHNHGNLCWGIGPDGKPKVVGLTDANGNCAQGINAGGNNPMVHVWIVPHPCGVFAALEGVGAGQAAVPDDQRVDLCNQGHTHTHATPSVPTKPYDPTQPIDLGGVAGVTPEQQAAAENLVAMNVVRLPHWADYHTAEAAGFHSIGDGATGFEHFIQWDWINDDVTLDPDHPESLVYQPQPDGSKKLVSAMYMLPDTVTLDKVPDIGGALMQWHIHDNLCFTDDPVAPQVRGLTDGSGNCPAPLVKFRASPMIHVWITPNKCGPFAALEGVGAGQILPGQERLCDSAHGSGGTTGTFG